MNQITATRPEVKNNTQRDRRIYKIENDAMSISEMVNNIAKLITPVWPIEKFIACNPLQSFESMSFEDAVIQNQTAKKGIPFNENLERVNWHMIKWCGGFLDTGQGTIEMPHRNKGFYFGFTKLAPFDRSLHNNKKSAKTWLLNLPKAPEQAIHICLNKLNVSITKQEEFLKNTLSYLPGWAGYIKWMSEWKNRTGKKDNPVSILDFLAVRLVITCLLWPDANQEKKNKKIIQMLKSLFKQ